MSMLSLLDNIHHTSLSLVAKNIDFKLEFSFAHCHYWEMNNCILGFNHNRHMNVENSFMSIFFYLRTSS
jgi:hypothetical protein